MEKASAGALIRLKAAILFGFSFALIPNGSQYIGPSSLFTSVSAVLCSPPSERKG